MEFRQQKIIFRIVVVLFILYLATLAPIGQYPDEDEKIAVAVYASQGWLPYKDILLNHGPLPYLLACIGYKAGGSVGAFFMLRALPPALAIISLFSIRKGHPFNTSKFTSIARLLWLILLAMVWAQGAVKTGVYHGIGGLLACIMLNEYLISNHIGSGKIYKPIVGAVAVLGLLMTLSLSFTPFVLIAIVAVLFANISRYGCTFPGNLPFSQLCFRQPVSHVHLVHLAGLIAAISPFIALAGLMLLKPNTLNGFYLGHIYFNLYIFNKLNPSINYFSFYSWTPSAFLIAISVAILPFVATYCINQQSNIPESPKVCGPNGFIESNSSLLYVSALLTSAAVFGQAYRTGIFSPINDLFSLPYLLPACYIIIIYSVRLAEQKNLAVSNKQISALSSVYVGYIIWAISFLPLGTVGWLRLHGKTMINTGTEPNLVLNSLLNRESLKDQFISQMIYTIESVNQRRATLFAWPYLPWEYGKYGRGSAYNVWFLPYNALVEKDPSLKNFQVCFKDSRDYPDIILYEPSDYFNQSSDLYGRCLVFLQSSRYHQVIEGVFLRKDNVKLFNSIAAMPKYRDLFLKPNWNPSDSFLSLQPITVDANSSLVLPIPSNSIIRNNRIYVKLATFKRANRGSISFCLVAPSSMRICSASFSKSSLLDNMIIEARFPGILALRTTEKFSLEIIDTSPMTVDQVDNRISVYGFSKAMNTNEARYVATWFYSYNGN